MMQPPYAPFIVGTINIPGWHQWAPIVTALIAIDERHRFNHAWLYRGTWPKKSRPQ